MRTLPEGCRYEKVECSVPVHSAQWPMHTMLQQQSYEPFSGKVSDPGEVQQEAR